MSTALKSDVTETKGKSELERAILESSFSIYRDVHASLELELKC